jgi:hypothetical protein
LLAEGGEFELVVRFGLTAPYQIVAVTILQPLTPSTFPLPDPQRRQGEFKLLNILGLQKAYSEFEFTSLRHAVSSVEKLWIFGPEMCEKGRTFATFATRTGPERKHQREHFTSDQALFSRGHIGSPLSRISNGERLAITIRTQCEG